MSPEKQRIAIAEACGYERIGFDDQQRMFGYANGVYVHVPHFLTDLNAMHEAEKTLTKKQRETYFVKLGAVLVWTDEGDGDAPMYWHHTHVTAARRAEAFLRTIGKWEDDS